MLENDILQLTIYIISGFITGFIFHTWVMPLLSKLVAKTSIQSDDLILNSIRIWVIPWFIALGLFLGLRRIEMDPRYHYWLENGVIIFYIFSLTLMTARVISGMIRIKSKESDTVLPASSIVSNIVKTIIYIIGLLIIFQSQNISITPMLTALGVGGLAVALALHNTLANLFAGLQIIASGKINHGDFVKLSSGEEGFIQDISWRSTTIRSPFDHIIIVPNSKMADMIVTNYFLPDHEISFSIEVGVSYDSDLEFVEKVTREVITQTLNETEGGVKDHEAEIRFSSFGDSRINLRAIMRVTAYNFQFNIKNEFIKKLHKRYQLEGINIPFPVHTVFLKKED